MLKRFLFCLFLFSLPLANFAQSNPKAEAQVLKLHQDKFRWMIGAQLDSLGALVDERVRYVHSNGWTESREEMLANLRSKKLAYHSITVEEAQARAYGKSSVVVVGKGKFSVSLDGKPMELTLLYTEVYAGHKKHWKLVSRQACKLQ